LHRQRQHKKQIFKNTYSHKNTNIIKNEFFLKNFPIGLTK
jgi:hypothetical protein